MQRAQGLSHRVGTGAERDSLEPRLLRFVQVVAGIGCAVEEAAQQFVVLFAQFAQALDDAMHGDAEQRQGVGGEHDARFERLGHDLGGAGGEEAFGIVLFARARHHRHVGPHRADAMQDA